MSTCEPEKSRAGFLNWNVIRLIETNADALRAYEIYRHLGEWLQNKSESDVERRYVAVGERRAAQGVPLSQLVLAIVATKEHLWKHIADEALTDRAVDLFQVLELSRSVEKFFDRAVYFAAIGYERCRCARRAAADQG